jgi:putative ABC transport system permease protein
VLNDLYIRRGRYIQPGRPEEVLVSEAFAKANRLKLGDTLGAIINGRWQRLRIVGIALSPEYVYEIRGTGEILPDNERFGAIWMGREALGTAFNMDGAFNDISLTLTPGALREDALFKLDRLLEKYGGLGTYGREDQLSNRFLSDEIEQLQATATLVPGIFLGIAAFLLHILLSRLIGLQRDQIAVLKAFGYSNTTIGLHYLKFGGVILVLGAVLGTLIGLKFGAAITQNYTRFFSFPLLRYEAGLGLVLTAILISGGSAILGAFLSVGRAVALPPAEAMRPEAPASFRPTFIERLGFQRLLSPTGRMLLRNLARQPVKAFLSTLGIALAIAMLVTGRYLSDAVERLIAVQFYHVQRDDVTVVFNEPRPARTRYEVAHLPGVIESEPFRSVAARLRFEHRSHRLGIMGLEPEGELRRLLDHNLHRVPLPPEGVVLTAKLAEMLGVKAGERLEVEVLEGARPRRTVAVAGLVDELLDVSAYMDIRALNRLLREGATISGSFLSVDANQLEELYARLKRIPAVTGVSLHQLAIALFRRTIAESLGILTTVMVVFACIIAFGVVYNSARIALSERSRELATLRIIGFSQGQVAAILLGEQAVIVLAALPLGSLLGYGLSALLSLAQNRELFRLPLILTKQSYAFAFIVVAIAACFSGLIVRRQLAQLDLIAVLKTRE